LTKINEKHSKTFLSNCVLPFFHKAKNIEFSWKNIKSSYFGSRKPHFKMKDKKTMKLFVDIFSLSHLLGK